MKTRSIYLEGNDGNGWQFAGTCKTVDEAHAGLAIRQRDYPQCQWRIVYPTESAAVKQQHTPGPWLINVNATGDLDVSPDGGDMICDLLGCTNAEANARLIASAPELLEALEGLIDQIQNGIPFKGNASDMKRASVETARAAIAKAKGETL